MVCPKCGSPVEGEDESCPNCGADLDRKVEQIDDKSEDLREMSQELKAIGESHQTLVAGDAVADRFEIVEFIDRGPFGEVYRAEDEIIEASVALKVFDEGVVETPPEQEQFLDATRAARGMTQENVVRIHDSGVHEDRPWVSMQYLEGLTLQKTIDLREKKDERFSLEELEPIVTQVTLALQHIGREFPHGALEPTNIFFLPDLLKVTDGYLLAALPSETFCERLGGSRYLAPELEESTEGADARCDVYSLGTIIAEMLFGPDYERGADTGLGAPEVEELCERAMAPDPEDRYPSVEALSEDFSTLVDTGQLLERSTPSEASPPEPPPGEQGGQPPETSDGQGPVDVGVEPQLDRPNAQFPEDAVATEDYDRPEGPGDHGGATQEMERSPKGMPDAPEAGPGATEEYDRGPPLGQGPTEEVDRDEYPPSDSEPADELPPEPKTVGETSPEQPGGRGDDGEEGSSAALYIVGILALIGMVAGGIVYLSGSVGREVAITGEGDRAESADAGSPSESGDESAALAEGVSAGSSGVDEALAAALDAAEAEAPSEEEGGDDSETTEGESGSEESGAEEAGGREAETGSSAAGAAASASEGGGAKEEAAEEGTECPDRMALVEVDSGNYCIDRYEYPGPGQKPQTNVTWFQAQSKCKSQGKRLCTLTEFRRACGAKYPWGDSWDASKCNTADDAGFPRSLTASGEFKECRSWPGVYDMVGNAHEWVKEQKIAGGGFDSGKKYAQCGNVSTKSPGSAAKTVGFRCCADPK